MDGQIKFVIVGDSGVGKSAFLTTWAFGEYPHEYITRVFCSWNYVFKADNGKEYVSTPWDTQGDEASRGINVLSYPHTDLFIYAYSVADPASIEHVTSKWVRETREHCRTAPCVLFGLQTDLRDSPKPGKELKEYITTDQGKELAASIGAKAFYELSALKDSAEVLRNAMHITMTVGADHVEQKRSKEGHKESQEMVENNEGHDKKGKCSVQ